MARHPHNMCKQLIGTQHQLAPSHEPIIQMDEAHILILVIGALIVFTSIAAVWAKLWQDTSPASYRHGPEEHVAQPVVFMGYAESARATWNWLNEHGFPATPLGREVVEKVSRLFGVDAPPLPTNVQFGPRDPFGTIPHPHSDDTMRSPDLNYVVGGFSKTASPLPFLLLRDPLYAPSYLSKPQGIVTISSPELTNVMIQTLSLVVCVTVLAAFTLLHLFLARDTDPPSRRLPNTRHTSGGVELVREQARAPLHQGPERGYNRLWNIMLDRIEPRFAAGPMPVERRILGPQDPTSAVPAPAGR
ncbi:hypothetical protein FRC01_011920 [Tulasnella sp. 417]|nr:hypothetical protein FRC01_011920 [Tulasnella sp. 417]